MESLDKHHETNAEALEDNCCVQAKSLIEMRSLFPGSGRVVGQPSPTPNRGYFRVAGDTTLIRKTLLPVIGAFHWKFFLLQFVQRMVEVSLAYRKS
jgi:hypothetical protein